MDPLPTSSLIHFKPNLTLRPISGPPEHVFCYQNDPKLRVTTPIRKYSKFRILNPKALIKVQVIQTSSNQSSILLTVNSVKFFVMQCCV